MKIIKVHNEHCLSVRCDFYQTCTKNSMSGLYQTKKKFLPLIVNGFECVSFDSGKRKDLVDNCYPNKLSVIYDYNLHSANEVVDFL